MITATQAVEKFNKESPVKALCIWDGVDKYYIAGDGYYDSYYKMDKNSGKIEPWSYQLELPKFREIMNKEPAIDCDKE